LFLLLRRVHSRPDFPSLFSVFRRDNSLFDSLDRLRPRILFCVRLLFRPPIVAIMRRSLVGRFRLFYMSKCLSHDSIPLASQVFATTEPFAQIFLISSLLFLLLIPFLRTTLERNACGIGYAPGWLFEDHLLKFFPPLLEQSTSAQPHPFSFFHLLTVTYFSMTVEPMGGGGPFTWFQLLVAACSPLLSFCRTFIDSFPFPDFYRCLFSFHELQFFLLFFSLFCGFLLESLCSCLVCSYASYVFRYHAPVRLFLLIRWLLFF